MALAWQTGAAVAVAVAVGVGLGEADGEGLGLAAWWCGWVVVPQPARATAKASDNVSSPRVPEGSVLIRGLCRQFRPRDPLIGGSPCVRPGAVPPPTPKLARVRAWYPVLIGALATQRWRELQLSRRTERARPGRRAAARTFPIMVAAHVALFVLPPLEVELTGRHPRRPGIWIGVLAAATGLRWWSISSLGAEWNVRAAVPKDLRPVTTGPYRWIRHPNYLAVILEFAALPMAGGAWISALGLSILDGAVLLDRISAEEALLFKAPGYAETFSGKARFIPGIF